MRVHNIQNNFNAGEFSPLMEGRTDLQQYYNAVRKLENFIPLPQGGVTRCPGTKYVNQVYNNSSVCRLIPFIPSSSDAYILLFIDSNILVYKNGAPVMSGGNQVRIASPYMAADLAAIKYAQKNDVLYLVHQSHAQRRLERSSDTDWALNTIRFDPPPSFVGSTNLNSALTPGATTGINVVFTAAVSDVFLAADVSRIISYKTSRASIMSLVESEKTVVSLTRSGGTATAEVTAHGYIDNDTVYILGTDQTEYNGPFTITLDLIDPTNKFTFAVSGSPASPATGTIKVARKVTTQSNKVIVDILDDFPNTNQIAAGNWYLLGSPVTGLTPSGNTPVGAVINLVSDDYAFRAGDKGKYIKFPKTTGEAGGLVKITTFIDVKRIKGEIIAALENNNKMLGGVWSLEVASWSSSQGYPGAITFFEDRLVFGGTPAQPQTIWGSETGGYENFSIGANDDASFVFTLGASELNKIIWLTGTKAIMVGTVSSEWELRGKGDDPISGASPPIARQHSTIGSSILSPLKINDKLLFTQRTKRKQIQIGFDFVSDSYLAADLTQLAEHITKGGIVDVALQQEPYQIIWIVRSDGVLVGMVYIPEQKIVSFFKRITDGEVKNVAVIPHPSGERDQVWLVVKRTINGVNKYYVEIMEDVDGYYDKYMTDCTVKYSGPATTTITGLGHLEGKTVDVLADGAVQAQKVVTNGQITLDYAASEVEAGLHYESYLETLRPEVQINGTAQGGQKRWNQIFIRVFETLNLVVNDDRIPFRVPANQMDNAVPTFSGDIQLSNAGWDKDGVLTIVQDQPLPATILAAFGTLSVGD